MPKTKWGSVIFTAYKFFDSKEFLFFVVLEDIHTEGFAAAQHSLTGKRLPCPRQSVRRRPFWRPCRWLSGDTGAGVHGKRRRVPAAPSAAGHPLHPLP